MKNLLFTLLLITFIFSTNYNKAQTGTDCANPNVITSLPFVQAGMTTAGSVSDYGASDACGSTYMDGEDYVFTYTPGSNQNISITLSNTGAGVGLFVLDDCPDQPADETRSLV